MTAPAVADDNVGPIGARAMLAPAVDIAVFLAATAHAVSLANAHLLSFGVAFILNYFLTLRGPATRKGRGSDPRLHIHFSLVGLFAVLLRGSLLGLFTHIWGWPAQISIVLVACLTLAVTLPGYAFALRTTAWTLGEGKEWQVFAVGLVAAAFLLRLLYITQLELLPEDSYYWNYSQHPALGYLDHPPMVAWLIWLGTAVFGNSEFGVRIGAVCCAGVASLFAYRLTRNLFGRPSALVALVLLQILPFFFLGGMLMTPDAPLAAAWAAALCFLERALIAGQARAWLLAGVSLGLGLISKYTIAMLVPAVFLFVVLDSQSRRWLLRWEPYAALLIALLIFSPVIFWNAQHEWASFAFQTSRRLAEAPRFALHKLIISVLVLLTPTGLLTLLLSRFSGVRGSPKDEGFDSRAWLFLRLSVLVPLSVFVAFSLRHDVKIDWTGALWLGAVPALAISIVLFGRGAREGIRAWVFSAWGPTAACMLLLYAAGLHYLALGLPGVGYAERLELVPVGWRDLGRRVTALAGAIRQESGKDPVIVGMDRYELASQLTFYMPAAERSSITSRNLFGQNGLMYGVWAARWVVGDRPLLLIAWDAHDLSDELTAGYAAQLGPVQEGSLTRDGSFIRHFLYRIGQGYRPVAATQVPGVGRAPDQRPAGPPVGGLPPAGERSTH